MGALCAAKEIRAHNRRNQARRVQRYDRNRKSPFDATKRGYRRGARVHRQAISLRLHNREHQNFATQQSSRRYRNVHRAMSVLRRHNPNEQQFASQMRLLRTYD